MLVTGQIRQGDVLLTPACPPRDAVRMMDVDGIRIAGERTGHAHVLAGEVRTRGGRQWVLPSEPAILHPEHGVTPVAPRWYEVSTQREYVPAVRRGRRTTGRWD